jgi:Flp pilus assembly pilin Flp
MGQLESFERITVMLKIYVRASDLLARLRSDKGGVVSFEYVIVAACIVAAVGLAFGTTASGPIGTALSGGIAKIAAALSAAP